MSAGPRRLVVGMLVLTVVLVVPAVLVPKQVWPFAPILAVPAFQLASIAGQSRHGPARFVVRNGTFAVPTNWAYAFQLASALASLPFLSGVVVAYWKFPGQVAVFRVVLAGLAVFASMVVVLMAVSVISQVVGLLRDRPVLALTPKGCGCGIRSAGGGFRGRRCWPGQRRAVMGSCGAC